MTVSAWQWIGMVFALILIGITLTIPMPQDKVVFLDVGQGDSILVQSGTQQILVDGGKGSKVLQRLGEELPWYDRTIDVVIATHPDQDHLEGLLHVLERYQVQLILMPHMPHTTQLQEAWITMLEDAARKKNIAYRFGWRGQTVTLDDSTFELLGPFEDEGDIVAHKKKTNNGAILGRLTMHDRSFLLTSDAESSVEAMLVEDTPPAMLDVDIVKAGHHGSKTSTSAALLTATTPQAVVISVGKDNQYGHPHSTVMDRINKYTTFRTDESGSIRFIHEQGAWFVSS